MSLESRIKKIEEYLSLPFLSEILSGIEDPGFKQILAARLPKSSPIPLNDLLGALPPAFKGEVVQELQGAINAA